MEMLGLPLEQRKKAFAGMTVNDLVQKYQEAERKRDIPTMYALLDIIKTAPKPPAGPPTTVKDDIMAAAQPAPMPTTAAAPPQPGVNGAVNAMAAQNAMQQPVMAADGGLMGQGDEEPTEMANGGVARFFLGGQGTVAPYSSFSALPIEDIERMAMMGDEEARKELSNRMRANIPRVAPTPGPGIGAESPQVTDQFRNKTWQTPPSPASTPAATPTPAAPAAPAQPPSGIRGLMDKFGRTMGLVGKATGIASLLQPTEANVGEEDSLAKMRFLQQRGGELDEKVRQVAGKDALMPRISFQQWKDKYFPEAKKTAPSPDLTIAPRETTTPTLPFGIDSLKPKTAEQYAKREADYVNDLIKKGEIKGPEQIKQALEEFRTEGKTRAEADRATAKEAFKDELLMSAALAAPQFLKGRGLAQATARAAETFSPMATKAMSARAASMKEATKLERDADDKFKLAQIDLDKAETAKAEGRIGRGMQLENEGMKTYVDAAIRKYTADMTHATYMNYADRAAVQEGIKGISAEIQLMRMDPKFKDLSVEQQKAYIDAVVRDRMSSLRSSVAGGINSLGNRNYTIQQTPSR